ncbi:hypothetical protein PsalMR5_04495 (plasmid) [Piscirickettsia salmonis]|uniref:hypothetical protein n=1 Tax=Piscirickettsia salmonis TaxID=1238 RepID=UPI0012BA9A49|nr:hypothetical protein [Piscirickettsia salmonis]QGP57010.1 hypothetical protein PsalSR1_04499 [Piscirickettsia salmonis]QGP61807.1 hypothetical protein PsalBI1_04449 [Piscirickettsia salmonis]QGP66570.1 hypothetical protein PsalMR5_04495 [Piscirickettsia salmonis]
MPSSRFDPQALKEIAILYMQVYKHDSSNQDPDNEFGLLYGDAQNLEQRYFSEEDNARVLRALLKRINLHSIGFSHLTDAESKLGYKIQKALHQFYDLSLGMLSAPDHVMQAFTYGVYSSSLEAYKSPEEYLKFPSSQLTDFRLVSKLTDTHQKATKQELLRRMETDGINKASAESAKAILALHSNVMSTGETNSTKESLSNPLVFTQLYTAHDNPEILEKTQRQLVGEFNETKDNEQLSTEDKSSALKKLKYALVDLIARSGKLEGVELEEVNKIIDYRRGHFTLTTNTRGYVSEHPRLKQILPAPKMLDRLFQQAAEAEAQEQSSTLTPEGESGHTLG